MLLPAASCCLVIPLSWFLTIHYLSTHTPTRWLYDCTLYVHCCSLLYSAAVFNWYPATCFENVVLEVIEWFNSLHKNVKDDTLSFYYQSVDGMDGHQGPPHMLRQGGDFEIDRTVWRLKKSKSNAYVKREIMVLWEVQNIENQQNILNWCFRNL